MLKPSFVSSSNLDALAYHHGDMYVRFHHGGCYVYRSVPYKLYMDVLHGDSAGQQFHKLIRGKFAFEKLEQDPFYKTVERSTV